MQQLPPMPPPAHYPPESLAMAVPSAPQQSPLTETPQQSSTQSQDRSTPLTPDQLAQQAANLKPYSKEDDNGWVYT